MFDVGTGLVVAGSIRDNVPNSNCGACVFPSFFSSAALGLIKFSGVFCVWLQAAMEFDENLCSLKNEDVFIYLHCLRAHD